MMYFWAIIYCDSERIPAKSETNASEPFSNPFVIEEGTNPTDNTQPNNPAALIRKVSDAVVLAVSENIFGKSLSYNFL